MFQLAKLFRETQRPSHVFRDSDQLSSQCRAIAAYDRQFNSIHLCNVLLLPVHLSTNHPRTYTATEHFISLSGILSQAFHFALLCSCPSPLMTSSGTSCDGLSHWLLSPGTYIQIIPTRSTIDAEERLTATLCSCQRRFASTCAYVGLAKTIEAHCEVEETAKNETRKIECTFPFKLIIMAKLCLFAKGGDVGGGTCTLQYTFKFYETCKNQSYYSFASLRECLQCISILVYSLHRHCFICTEEELPLRAATWRAKQCPESSRVRLVDDHLSASLRGGCLDRLKEPRLDGRFGRSSIRIFLHFASTIS